MRYRASELRSVKILAPVQSALRPERLNDRRVANNDDNDAIERRSVIGVTVKNAFA